MWNFLLRCLLLALLVQPVQIYCCYPVFSQEPLTPCVIFPLTSGSGSESRIVAQRIFNDKVIPALCKILEKPENKLKVVPFSTLKKIASDSKFDLYKDDKPWKLDKALKKEIGSHYQISFYLNVNTTLDNGGLNRNEVLGSMSSQTCTVGTGRESKTSLNFSLPCGNRFPIPNAKTYDEMHRALEQMTILNLESDPKLVDSILKQIESNIPYYISFKPLNTTSNTQTASELSPSVPSVPSAIRDKWALIVGISDFQDKRIPKLKYSAKDARDFRDFLVKECNFAPDHVRLLLNEKATERRVASELGNKFLARVAKPGDLTVLYFSTHGSSSKADLKGKNYLVAYDSDRDDLYATGIEMQKITDAISERVDSGRVLLVLDACHSGATTGGAKAMSNPGNFDAEELAQGSGKLVICSSKPDQQSWESARYQNGVFTRKLIEGLRLKGKKTKLEEAFTFVQTAVKSEVQEDHAIKQEPVLRSKWDGSGLLIAVPPSAPQALPQSVKSILEPDSSAVSPVMAPKAIPGGKAIRKR